MACLISIIMTEEEIITDHQIMADLQEGLYQTGREDLRIMETEDRFRVQEHLRAEPPREDTRSREQDLRADILRVEHLRDTAIHKEMDIKMVDILRAERLREDTRSREQDLKADILRMEDLLHRDAEERRIITKL